MSVGADPEEAPLGPLDFGIGQLFEVIPDAVIVGDAVSGRIVLWNAGATDIFGYEPEQAVGMLIEELIPEELREQHRAGLARFASEAASPLVDSHAAVELPAIRRDGTRLVVELRLSRLRRRPSHAAYVLAILRDVTERRKLQDSVETVAAQNADRAAWLRTFFSMAAHDLANPLMVVIGVLDVVARALEDDPQMLSMVDVAHRQAEQLRRLVEDIMAVARLETGAVSSSPEVVGLRLAVLEASVGHVDPVTVRVPENLAVMADRSHLNRIVHNLVANALKHGAPPVVVDAVPEASGVRLQVTDSGGGVPDDIVDRLFEPFTRSEFARVPGSGLGLAAVRKLAELNGGRAWYDASVAGTATFCVWLPAGGLTADR